MRLTGRLGAGACRRWRRAIWQEVDGFLSARERARLLAHAAGCERCRIALEQARRLDVLLATPPSQLLSDEFDDRVLLGVVAGLEAVSRSPERLPRPAPGRRRAGEAGDWWILGGGLAAAGCLAALAFAIVPRLALQAVHSAVAPQAPSDGAGGLPLLGLKALFASGQMIAGLLQSPLALPLLLMAAVVAATVGWVRLALSRPTW